MDADATARERAWDEGRLTEFVALTEGLPDDAFALRLRRAAALRRVGRVADARAVLAALLPRLGADPVLYPEALLEQANHADDIGRALAAVLAVATELGAVETIVAARARLGLVRLDDGDPYGALAALGADEQDHPFWCIVRGTIAWTDATLGDADAWYARAQALGDARPGPEAANHAGLARVRRGELALVRGQLERARTHAADALARIGTRPDAAIVRSGAWNVLAEVARERGDDAAERAYREALAARDDPLYRLNLAHLDLERGRVDAARAALTELRRRRTSVTVGFSASLALAACAAVTGAPEADDPALHPCEGRDPLPDPHIARVAERTAAWAMRHRGWQARVVRLRRLALVSWRGLERAREAAAQERALRRLADAGARPQLRAFTLDRPLASGAFGEVWRARHERGTEVAIKVFVRGGSALERELRAVAALDHPHVVRLLDHGTVDAAAAVMVPTLQEGAPWIATELADGTLEPHLGRWPWPEVARRLVEILDALAHAHARGLVHLDVKPANVLLSGGRAMVADFGLARAVGESGVAAGTPAYMAPEQFSGAPLGPWTDLYATGCLAAAMVSGAPPFCATTIEGMRDLHCGTQPTVEPRIAVPSTFFAWVRRLLAKRLDERFVRAADAAAALRALGIAEGAGDLPPIPLEALPTVVLPAIDGAPAPVAMAGDLVAVPSARVPARWERPESAVPPLDDAGLALFGLRRPALVGREAIRSRLWAVLREVVDHGAPRAVVLEGAPGHGSSALAEWLCERAHEVGAADVVTVRRAITDRPGEALGRALGLLPWDGAGPGERHLRIAAALADASVRRPLVLRVERGAVDRELRGALHLLGRLRGRVLVLVPARPGEVEGIDAERLPVPPMTADEQRRLLAGLVAFDVPTLDRLATLTAGDPRFAVQLVTDLVAGHRIEPGPEGARLLGRDLPASMGELWRDRLRSALVPIGADARASLRLAALLAPAVDDALWTSAVAHAGLRFSAEGRDALLDARLATPLPGGWAWTDPDLSAALAASATGALHAACAAAIEAAGGDPAVAAARWEAADRPSEAAAALRRALAEARTQGITADVDGLVARLSALIPRLAPEEADLARIEVPLARGVAAAARLAHDLARAELAHARELATRAGRADRVDDLRVIEATADHLAGRRLRAREELERIALGGATALAYRAAERLAVDAMEATRYDDARRWLARALELAEPLGAAAVAMTCASWGGLHQLQRDPAKALPWFVRARDLARSAANRGLIGLALATVLRDLGRTVEAERELLAAEEAAERSLGWFGPVATIGRAVLRWSEGRTDEGDTLADAALERIDPRLPSVAALAAVARLARRADDPDEVAFEDVRAAVARAGVPPGVRDDARPCFAIAAARARSAGMPERAGAVERLATELGVLA